ncbi:hypothetical protein ACBJ59_10590 [Nonomuraea sp. MTCD27]|uniref:hypothetical protein n=1 Tax=Nonomuraea sp. MTCD27 TaxID=1676747 RepID=UPI0035BF74A0
MAARTSKQTGDKTPGQEPPPYYIATAPLFIGGSQFARAFNPGDHVPPGHVDEHGWHDQVRAPDGYEMPAKPSNDEPETPTGQATTEGKGDA